MNKELPYHEDFLSKSRLALHVLLYLFAWESNKQQTNNLTMCYASWTLRKGLHLALSLFKKRIYLSTYFKEQLIEEFAELTVL